MIRTAGCRLSAGQSATVTSPPVASAAARNGTALDRSGSMSMIPGEIDPGSTRQIFATGPRSPVPARLAGPGPAPVTSSSTVRTSAPQARSIRTVISMCGADGSAAPQCLISAPAPNRGGGQQQAGDQLRGRRGVDRHRSARHRAAAVHDERDRAGPVVGDRDAELAQGGEQRPDRPLRHSRVAQERHVGAGQGGHRRHEPQHGARVADIDADAAPAGCRAWPAPG